MFDWGHSKRGGDGRPLVPDGVLLSVRSVRELRAGRSAAKESKGKRAVPWADVEKTLGHLGKSKDRPPSWPT